MYNICINSLKTEYMNTVYFDRIHPILPLILHKPTPDLLFRVPTSWPLFFLKLTEYNLYCIYTSGYRVTPLNKMDSLPEAISCQLCPPLVVNGPC